MNACPISPCRRLRPQPLALALSSLLCAPVLVAAAPDASVFALPQATLTATTAVVNGVAPDDRESIKVAQPSALRASEVAAGTAVAGGPIAPDSPSGVDAGTVPTAVVPVQALASTGAAEASFDARDARTLEGVEVQGKEEVRPSLTALALERTGNQVQVVSARDIEVAGYTNLAEIAQGLIRGANVGYSPDEGEFTIRLDGGGDRDTLVTLDGMPLYDRGPGIEEIWGATLIDPHMVESIEVFRGGQSLYFGSNAGIGVVNVVTKKPDGERKGQFGVSYGRYDSREMWANYTFPLDAEGQHAVMFYGSRQASDGPQLFSEESQTDNHLLAGGIQGAQTARDSTGVKYRWAIDDVSELNTDLLYVETNFSDTFPDTTIYGPTRVTMPAVKVQYSRDWSERLRSDVYLSWRNPTLWNTKFVPQVCRLAAGCPNPTNPSVLVPRGRWTGGLDAQAGRGIGDASIPGGFEELVFTALNRYTFNPQVELMLGLQSINYRDTSDPRILIDDDLVSNNALIADLVLTPSFSPGTTVSLAGRVDYEDSFGSKSVGKFGFRHDFDAGLYLRANGGTSFSLPKTNELFFNSPEVVGNPDLEPEETETLNVGAGIFRTLYGRVFALDVGAFRTDITNRIQTTTGLRPNTRFNNAAVTEIRGLVGDVSVELSDNWRFNLSYTRQKARLAGGTKQINATPEWFATGQISYTTDDQRWQFTLLPRWQGPEIIQAPAGIAGLEDFQYGDWFLLNGSIQFAFGAEREQRLNLRLVNLGDELYGERGAFGNRFYDSSFIRGEYTNRDARYFNPYIFQGKRRSLFLTYSVNF